MKATQFFAVPGAIHPWRRLGPLARATVPTTVLSLAATLSADCANGAPDISALLRLTSNYDYRGYSLSDNHAAVQGNIDPMLMITGGEALDRDVDDLLAMLGDGRLIVNLGHGITPEAKVENVERLIARVRDRAA